MASPGLHAAPPAQAYPPVIRCFDSITTLTEHDAGCIAVAASHAGHIAGALAAACGVAAVIFNDAGIGKDNAGIASLDELASLGLPAAAASHLSCRIGDGQDQFAHGVIAHVNAPARLAGCRPGMSVRDCAQRLAAAHDARPVRRPAYPTETRCDLLPGSAIAVFGLDSVSLLQPGDAGAIVVTASHGGMMAATHSDGVPPDVLAVSFHDAGGGKDDAGFGRLPLLQTRGIAAVTVAADSARIGDARSCYDTGRISRANAAAMARGAAVGQPLQDFIQAMLIVQKRGR